MRHHVELTDEQVDAASIEELRAAYRELRAHHVAETAELIWRMDKMRSRLRGEGT